MSLHGLPPGHEYFWEVIRRNEKIDDEMWLQLFYGVMSMLIAFGALVAKVHTWAILEVRIG